MQPVSSNALACLAPPIPSQASEQLPDSAGLEAPTGASGVESNSVKQPFQEAAVPTSMT
jgi:hypothetical protein